MKRIVLILALCFQGFATLAQMPDTTGIYGERRDSLDAAVFSATGSGTTLSRFKDIRTEVISASGLCKMACCNLAESFENSASVTVGYSDAVTGARQIRLLGQSGIYTQMLDENRPVMRGLSAPWGLNFVPSQWLESIQIAKGVTSVINGVESMTGQINMEHRKPADEIPLFVHASVMADSRVDFNASSSLQLDEEGRWSTVILAHGDANFVSMDRNGDGFMDEPRSRNLSVSNRWLYYDPSGLQIRFGGRLILDDRTGGAMDEKSWRAGVLNRDVNAYFKAGLPIGGEQEHSFAVVADYTFHTLDSQYGVGIPIYSRSYFARQHSGFVNLLYQDNSSERHHYTVGVSDTFDSYDENVMINDGRRAGVSTTNFLGAFAEYTFRDSDRFSAIVGIRADWFKDAGVKPSPRLTLKWAPIEDLVFRANGGRGLRYSLPLVDNIGIFSTQKIISGDYLAHLLEDSWTFGGNVTWYLPFDSDRKTYLSLDYFRTAFSEKLLVDYDTDETISMYSLGSVGGRSFTNNVQLDFSTEPFRGFTLNLTARYTDARETYLRGGKPALCAKPMTSRFKGVLNLQYATRLNKWIFDFTASANGPCDVWEWMRKDYPEGHTPWYPMLYAQITKRFKGFDVYLGGENLTGFTQKNPILNYKDPLSEKFDASLIWGPLMGIKIYAGLRITIWKTV